MNEPVILMDNRRHIVTYPYTRENLAWALQRLGLKPHWLHAGRRHHIDAPVRMEDALRGRTAPVTSRDIVRVIRGGEPFVCCVCGRRAVWGLRHGRTYRCREHWRSFTVDPSEPLGGTGTEGGRG